MMMRWKSWIRASPFRRPKSTTWPPRRTTWSALFTDVSKPAISSTTSAPTPSVRSRT